MPFSFILYLGGDKGKMVKKGSKWIMGLKEAEVVGSVWWRMFMKPQKGMIFCLFVKPWKGTKVIYGRYDMTCKKSLKAHLHSMFKVPLVNLCEIPWDGIIKCCKCDVHAFLKLDWIPIWILFPLLGGWLHRSLGWEVSLHGSLYVLFVGHKKM